MDPTENTRVKNNKDKLQNSVSINVEKILRKLLDLCVKFGVVFPWAADSRVLYKKKVQM